MGAYEVVRELLEPLGGWVGSVAMQPGGPQATGAYRGMPVIGFPGNPVSAQLSFELFVAPTLRAIAGLPPAAHRATRARRAAHVRARQAAVPARATHRRRRPRGGRGRTRVAPRGGARGIRPAHRRARGRHVARRRRPGRYRVPMTSLTHLDDDGRARMVDVGAKPVTRRVAIAEGRLDTTAEVVALVRSDGLKKADVLATARIAGISGAKRTSELIPLAHIVPLDAVSIDFGFEDAARSTIRATVVDDGAHRRRDGGAHRRRHRRAHAARHGEGRRSARRSSAASGWSRSAAASAATGERMPRPTRWIPPTTPARPPCSSSRRAPRRARRDDTTGPVIVDWLRERGFDVDEPVVVADADVADAIRGAVAGSPSVLITTGGTGVQPRRPHARGDARRARPGAARRRRGDPLGRARRHARRRRSAARSPGSPDARSS